MAVQQQKRAPRAYIIDGGAAGAARLAVLSRVFAPSTHAFLLAAGLRSGAHCLDVGCGSGEVTRHIAAVAAPGTALGVDMDPGVIAIARERSAGAAPAPAFAVLEADTLDEDLGRFDLVYARFLLSHHRDPVSVLRRLAGLCAPGGVVAVEDVDIAAAACDPPSPAYDQATSLYRRAAEAGGADARLGPRLPALFTAAGFARVRATSVQPGFRTGEGKLLHGLTLRTIRAAALAAGLIDADDLERLLDDLDRLTDDRGTRFLLPRIHQVVGRTAAAPALRPTTPD